MHTMNRAFGRSFVLFFLVCLLSLIAVCPGDAFFGRGNSNKKPVNSAEEEVDYYEILGLSELREEATEKDIRQKFRQLSRKYHPDVSKSEDARAMYSSINRANEVLSDKRKRRMYDMRGEEGLKQLEAFEQQGPSMDPFARLFGGGGGGLKGPNTEASIHVSLEDVYSGAEKSFSIAKDKVCHQCKGTGARKGSQLKACPHCGGQGVVIQRFQFGPGMYQDVQQTCPHCQGRGRTARDICPACRGKRITKGQADIKFDVEQGVPEGHKVTFEMESNESPDLIPGDLILTIHTEKHPLFTRLPNGMDLETTLRISFRDALLGFEREVKHLDGELVPVRQNGVTAFGTVLKIRGKGMPRHHLPSERGDLYVKVVFELPKTLTEEQIKEIEENF